MSPLAQRNSARVHTTLQRLGERDPEAWWTAAAIHSALGPPMTLGQVRWVLGRLDGVERRREGSPKWDRCEYRLKAEVVV